MADTSSGGWRFDRTVQAGVLVPILFAIVLAGLGGAWWTARLDSKVETVGARLVSLETTVASADRPARDLATSVALLAARIGSLESSVTALRDPSQDMTVRLARMEERMTALNEAIASLARGMTRIEEQGRQPRPGSR